ncbi:MAG: ATP phosphoribosyltransferase [Ignavibacteriae bacterium]|nr:ATP phosphoribosyltransferase [Ignavibacteria bacterium]MBI3365650.1 ATP phosphoribosyltransferase [Ignavibacteriota bacterium]
MPAGNGRLKIAVQKEGRITDDSMNLLKAMGLDLEFRSRTLFSPCRNFPLDLLSVRDDDIPEYVQDGVSDFGIVGENIVAEKRARVTIVERLGFGKCRLVICVPDAGNFKALTQLKGKRIATSYPVILKRFLAVRKLRAKIVEISGSVEIAPALDVADATCDIVSTGSTARLNGLSALYTVMESEAVLIANASSLHSRQKRKAIEQLLVRIRSSLNARGKKYVMMNAPTSAIKTLRTLIPGMKSPTIVPLANPNMVAVHSVVGENVFWDVMEQLKSAGATDIVVIPIEKFIA